MSYGSVERNLGVKLYVLLVLNALDAFFTYIGVQAKYIQELNPLMVTLVENIWFVIFVKIGLMSALILFLMKGLKTSKLKRVSFSKFFINTGVAVYGFITVNHFWILWQVSQRLSNGSL